MSRRGSGWLLVASVLAFACGPQRGGGGGDDDDDDDASADERPTFACCIDGDGYACPDQEALDRCGGFDVGACLEDCAFDDPACSDGCFDGLNDSEPDPGACTPDAGGCRVGGNDDDECIEETYPGCENSGDCCGTAVCNEYGYCEAIDACSGVAIGCDLDLDCCDGLVCTPRDDGFAGGSCSYAE